MGCRCQVDSRTAYSNLYCWGSSIQRGICTKCSLTAGHPNSYSRIRLCRACRNLGLVHPDRLLRGSWSSQNCPSCNNGQADRERAGCCSVQLDSNSLRYSNECSHTVQKSTNSIQLYVKSRCKLFKSRKNLLQCQIITPNYHKSSLITMAFRCLVEKTI